MLNRPNVVADQGRDLQTNISGIGAIRLTQSSHCTAHALDGSTTTDREPNNADWKRRAIIQIFYNPQSHLAYE